MLVLFSVNCFGAVPQLINYPGKLTDNLGNPITDTKSITFYIYDAETSGNQKWFGIYPVVVNKGVFNVLLGSGVYPFLSNLDFSADYWLEMKVEGQTLTPRQKITTVAYSMRSEYSNRAEVVNTPMVYVGHGDIDANVSEKCYIHLDKTPKLVKIYLYGEKFDTQHYTELAIHSHTGTTATQVGDHTHTVSHSHTARVNTSGGGVIAALGSDTGSFIGILSTDAPTTSGLTGNHTHTFTSDNTGINGGTVSTSQKTYLNDMKVYLDGEDLAYEITSTLLSRASVSMSKFGDGTQGHALNLPTGSGSIIITDLLATTGQHYLVFKQSGVNMGGRIRYNVYVTY